MIPESESGCVEMIPELESRFIHMVPELESACLDDMLAESFEEITKDLEQAEELEEAMNWSDDVVDDPGHWAEEESPSFFTRSFRQILQWWEGRKKPEHRVIRPDEFFVNKGDKLFTVDIDHIPDQFVKSAEWDEVFARDYDGIPIHRLFEQPKEMEYSFLNRFVHEDVRAALQSFTYQSVHLNVRDRETKDLVFTLDNCYEWMELKVLSMKDESRDKLKVEMNNSSPKRSERRVDEIPNFLDAAVELQREDDEDNIVKFVFYYGGSRMLLCAKDARSEFLDEHYVHEYDALLNIRALIDCIVNKNNKHVHYFLLLSEPGKNDYSRTAKRKNPLGLQSLTGQVTFYTELICFVLFIIVAFNGTQEYREETWGSIVPFCVAAHPQDLQGFVSHIVDKEGHLLRAMFSNPLGGQMGNSLICCAGTKERTKSKDLDGVLIGMKDLLEKYFGECWID